MEQLTILFLGPQGSGKGTHVDLLSKELAGLDPNRAIVSFEAGKHLRELAAGENYTSLLARERMGKGELLPLFLSTRAFSDYLIHSMEKDVHLFIDGFPRTADQLPVFDSAMQFYGRTAPKVISITISDEEAMRRLMVRKRADDTEEGIKKRLTWTRQQSGAIHEWFRANSMYQFIEINGDQSIEAVHKDILAALNLS